MLVKGAKGVFKVSLLCEGHNLQCWHNLIDNASMPKTIEYIVLYGRLLSAKGYLVIYMHLSAFMQYNANPFDI